MKTKVKRRLNPETIDCNREMTKAFENAKPITKLETKLTKMNTATETKKNR
jgi:hypothetical protein